MNAVVRAQFTFQMLTLVQNVEKVSFYLTQSGTPSIIYPYTTQQSAWGTWTSYSYEEIAQA